MAGSFVAKADSDSENSSDFGGTAAYTESMDWANFENDFRGWGMDGGTFPNADQRGRCDSGTCRIWDWSMTVADTVVKDVLVLPAGNDIITHTWSDSSTTTFLRNSVEIGGDDIGNDNGLCESNETCLFTPNIGSYQGHGQLISAGSFTDGTLVGITLLRYGNNGY